MLIGSVHACLHVDLRRLAVLLDVQSVLDLPVEAGVTQVNETAAVAQVIENCGAFGGTPPVATSLRRAHEFQAWPWVLAPSVGVLLLAAAALGEIFHCCASSYPICAHLSSL